MIIMRVPVLNGPETTMPVVYGRYILAIYHDHSVHSGQTVVFLVYTTGGAFELVIYYYTAWVKALNILSCDLAI